MVLAGYETKDESLFPELAFSHSLSKLSPAKYWQYLSTLTDVQDVKRFCMLMRRVSSCQASSAGIERLFSSNSLVQTKLRNRLSNAKVAKLARVYRGLGQAKAEEVDEDVFDDLFV